MASTERQTFKDVVRAELKWRNLFPHYHTAEPFVKPLWRMPSALFIVYRVGICVYLNSWLVVISYWAGGHPAALMYFTAWGYITLCFSTLLLAVLTVHSEILVRRARVASSTSGNNNSYVAVALDTEAAVDDAAAAGAASGAQSDSRREEVRQSDISVMLPSSSGAVCQIGKEAKEPLSSDDDDGRGSRAKPVQQQQQPLSFLVKLAWIAYSVAAVMAPLITFAYFCVVVPLSHDEPELLNAANLNLHAVNTLVVIIESFVCAMPSRLAFALYSDAFFAVYVVSNVAYWSADRERNVLYPVIGDWGNYWHVGLPLTFVVLLLGIPLIHGAYFLKYRLQIFAYERVYRCSYEHAPLTQLRCHADA